MSKVEKSGSVEVKVVKTEDEGGEFHTQQVGIFLSISRLHQLEKDCLIQLYIFRAIKRRSSKEEGVATILLGTKSTKRTEEGLARLYSPRPQIPCNHRNSSAGDKKFEREGGRGQGQGGGKRQGGKEEKPRWPFACSPQFRTQTQVSQCLGSRPWQGRGISGCIVEQGGKATG